MANLTAIRVDEFSTDDIRFFDAVVEIEWEETPDNDVDERGPSGYSPEPISSKIIKLVEFGEDDEGEWEETWNPAAFKQEEPEIYQDIIREAETTLIEGNYDEDEGIDDEEEEEE